MTLVDAFGLVPMTGRVQPRAQTLTRTSPPRGNVPPFADLNDPYAAAKEAVKRSLGQYESGNRYNIANDEGYMGKYQFGKARLSDLGLGGVSRSDFLKDPALQERAMDAHLAKMDQEITARGMDRYEGSVVGGVPITRAALYGMMHLGGAGGANAFLKSGGRTNSMDSNKTSIGHYGKVHGAAKGFADRQGQEVADIQTDMQNSLNEFNQYENNTAMLFSTPEQKKLLAQLPEFSPIGGPTVQGTPYDPYQIAYLGNEDIPRPPALTPQVTAPTVYGDMPNAPIPPAPAVYGDMPNAPVPEAVPPAGDTTAPNVTPKEVKEVADIANGADIESKVDEPIASKFDRLDALGRGLAQISAGQVVDVSGAWKDRISRYNAGTARENTEISKKQEERLRAKQKADIDALSQDQAGRDALAVDYFKRTNDVDGALAIRSSSDAAADYSRRRFNPPATKTGSADTPPDYADPDFIKSVAEAAANSNLYGPDIAERIISDPTGNIAKQVNQEMWKSSSAERLAGNANADAIQSIIQEAAAKTEDPIEQEYLRKQLMALEVAKQSGDPTKITSVADALSNYILADAKTRLGIMEAGGSEAARIASRVAANNEVVDNFFGESGPQTPEDIALHKEMAALAANGEPLSMKDLRDFYKEKADRASAEYDKNREMEQDKARFDTAKMWESVAPDAASLLRAGEVTAALERYKEETGANAPESVKLLQALSGDEALRAIDLERRMAAGGLEHLGTKAAMANVGKELDADAARVASAKKAAVAANELIGLIAANPDVRMGGIRGALTPYAGYLDSAGIDITGDITVAQLMDALMKDMARNRRIVGEGAASNFDQRLLQESSPEMRKTRLGNLMLSQMIKTRAADAEWELNKKREWYATQPIEDVMNVDARDAWMDAEYEKSGLNHASVPFVDTTEMETVTPDTLKKEMELMEQAHGPNVLIQIKRPSGSFWYVTGEGAFFDQYGEPIQ